MLIFLGLTFSVSSMNILLTSISLFSSICLIFSSVLSICLLLTSSVLSIRLLLTSSVLSIRLISSSVLLVTVDFSLISLITELSCELLFLLLSS